MYWAVQVLTLAVLVLAANTSFQGFPRLAALLARDRFFARQFTNLGDRLVFSNGIIVLAAVASGLLVVYNASVDSLIHLYVIGVFTAFTLSQAGMVRYWLRTHDAGWRHRVADQRRRRDGDRPRDAGRDLDEVHRRRVARDRRDPAARPLRSSGINRHYRRFARRLAAGVGAVTAAGDATNRVLVWVESLDVATEGALWYARQIADDRPVRALVAPGRHTDPAIRPRWFDFAPGGPKLEKLSTEEGRTAGDARAGVAAAARRVGLRHGRRAGAVPRQVAAVGDGSDVLPPQAAAALRARDGRRRRARGVGPARPGGHDARSIWRSGCWSPTSTPGRCGR